MKRTALGSFRQLSATGAILLAAAVVAAAVGIVVAGGSYAAPLPGIPDSGAVVAWGTPILRALTNLAAVVTIGWLLAATFLDPSGRDGIVSVAGRRDLKWAAIAAIVWAELAIVQMFFELANVLGVPLSQAITPDVVSTYANAVPTTRALFVMAVLAAIVAVGALATSTTGASSAWLLLSVVAAVLPALAGHSAGLGDHALAMTSGVTHVVAAVLWMGGLAALAVHASRRDMPMLRAVQRFSAIAVICVALLAVSGFANAYTRLDSFSQLFSTGYGQVILVKTILIGALGCIGWFIRRRMLESLAQSSPVSLFARIAGLELLIGSIALGLGVALASSPTPRIPVEMPTYGESILGFLYPPAPTFANVGLGFQLDALFFTASVIAGAVYLAGVVRLIRRGDGWPVLRTVSWLVGLAIVVWCTNAGISMYAQVSVGLHMLQHMTLTMLGPIFLVMGAPATLALRALRPAVGNERGPREWVVWFLHSWITRILTNPFFVLFIYAVGLYGLYMTSLFGWLMGSHVGHVAMQLHFVLSGYLFYWVLIGIDPRPRPLPYWARLLLLLIAVSIHGFFAVALMSGTVPIALDWYGLVQPPWITDPLKDSLDGAQVAWGLSEIPMIIVLIAIAVQWSRSDAREAKRNDRQADRDGDAELNAYNDSLAAMARNDEHRS